MGEVVPLRVVEVGDGYKIEAAKVLEGAAQQDFAELVVVGRTVEGDLYLAGTTAAGDSLMLMEHAKYMLLHGDCSDD